MQNAQLNMHFPPPPLCACHDFEKKNRKIITFCPIFAYTLVFVHLTYKPVLYNVLEDKIYYILRPLYVFLELMVKEVFIL